MQLYMLVVKRYHQSLALLIQVKIIILKSQVGLNTVQPNKELNTKTISTSLKDFYSVLNS